MAHQLNFAGVAELADALDLGSSGFTVGVQVPSPAPYWVHICGSGSVVEHRLAKARVAGSNPVFRSKHKTPMQPRWDSTSRGIVLCIAFSPAKNLAGKYLLVAKNMLSYNLAFDI